MPTKKKTETEKEVKEETKDIAIEANEKKKIDGEIDEKIKSKADEAEDKAKKLKELRKKAEKLAEKIEIKDKKDIKEEVEREAAEKKRKRQEKTLFPLDDYVKYNAHLGTKAVTPHMRQFVYRRRADGIAVLNTTHIDEKLQEAIAFLKDFKAEDIFLACKREAGWDAVKKFGESTGIKVFTKKYPAGIITNLQLKDFFETELVIICDPWLDKNALNDAVRVKVPVISLCDTNNLTTGVTKIIPGNNKSAKSLGLLLYLIARGYLKTHGKEKEAEELNIEEFTGVPEEEKETFNAERGAVEGV